MQIEQLGRRCVFHTHHTSWSGKSHADRVGENSEYEGRHQRGRLCDVEAVAISRRITVDFYNSL
jgi:hypothetical protein